MNWINVNEKLPETKQRVVVSLINENGIRWTTCADYIAPKSVLADDYMDEDHWEFHEYDDEKDCYWTCDGFYESNYYTEVNYFIHDKVTHWMSLPEKPIES